MKVEVLERFVHRGVRIAHPGEILDVGDGEGEFLIQQGIAKEVKSPKPKEEEEEA